MAKHKTRLWVTLSLVLSGAFLCTSGNLTCGSFGSEAAVSSLDMCFIFDCTNGILGGIIDPCANVGGSDAGGGGGGTGGGELGEASGGPFFTDCETIADGGE
jgi:hypothetical protein